MRRMSKVWRIFLLAAVMIVLGCSWALAEDEVKTIHPENVKIHLYDYWVTGENDEDSTSGGNLYDHAGKLTGINTDAALLFIGNGGQQENYGWWNGRRTGRVVKPYLGEDGFPSLDLEYFDYQTRYYPDTTNELTSKQGTREDGTFAETYNKPGKDAEGNEIVTPITSYIHPTFSGHKNALNNQFDKTLHAEGTAEDTPLFGTGATGTQSLAYLFSKNSGAGKKYYGTAERLLQYDESTRNYYFDSTKNYAYYNKTGDHAGEFTVSEYTDPIYFPADANGVAAAGGPRRFFPFNTLSQYTDFCKGTNGTAYWMVNHYFGTMIEVDFYMTEDGMIDMDGNSETTNDRVPMTFKFSGDDDVYIFVDNLLVGAAGGIHGPRRVEINFATGEVVEDRSNSADPANSTNNNTAKAYTTNLTTYYNMALERLQSSEEAGGMGLKREEAEDYLPTLKDGTFEPNTRHTLRMFYLERGNWDSNMSIYFNLYYPYNSYTVQNTITGGNQALRGINFPYDLAFDMGDVILGLITDETVYTYEAYAGSDTADETGTVKIDRTTGKITQVTPEGGGTSRYLDAKDSRAYLSDGERVVFSLPDAAEVTVTQNNPGPAVLAQLGLTADPYDLETLTVTPEAAKISNAEPTVVAKIIAANDPTIAAYLNVIRTGSLKIVKEIDALGDNLPLTDQMFTFDVTVPEIGMVTDKTYPTTLTATVEAGETTAETAVISDIVLGAQVTIAEQTGGLMSESFLYLEGDGTYPITTADQTVEAEFTNLYAAALPVNIGGIKTLVGGVLQAGQFSFTIAAADDSSPMPEETTVVNDAEGKFAFGPMTYIKPGVHTYTITEVWGDDPYIDYDTETAYEVTVNVTANTENNTIVLEPNVEIKKKADGEKALAELIEFHNFTRGGVQIKLRKLSSYDDRVLPGAEFELSHDPQQCPVCRKKAPALMMLSLEDEQTQETEGPTLDTQNVTTQTAVTDQYGAIIFRGLIEGHVYTLTETKAPADYNLPEKNTWQVVNRGGTLEIDNVPESGALVIHNRPTYWPVELQLQAAKTMEGREPGKTEKFGFRVVDAKGNVIREAENDLGMVTFAPIVIEKAGTYRYDIMEPWGGNEKIWYDKAVYTVTAEVVAVEDTPGEGRLEIASITYEKDGQPYDGEPPVFANRKAPKLPPTGDQSRMGFWLALLGLAGAGALVIFLRRRRKA